jgi:hypothetical protein
MVGCGDTWGVCVFLRGPARQVYGVRFDSVGRSGARCALSLQIKVADVGEVNRLVLAAPCGLYCGVCEEAGCHGCGCECGSCSGQGHAQICGIAQCVKGKGLESCADCQDMPCTELIQFTYDPVWRTHAPCIENLRRRRMIGVQAWLQEQEAYWRDDTRRRDWRRLGEECSRRAQEFKESGND